MSKHSNVNPAHYKVAGRERPGDDVPDSERAVNVEQDRDAEKRWEERQKAKRDQRDEDDQC